MIKKEDDIDKDKERFIPNFCPLCGSAFLEKGKNISAQDEEGYFTITEWVCETCKTIFFI